MLIYKKVFIYLLFIQIIFSNEKVIFNKPDSLVIHKTLDSLVRYKGPINMQYYLSSYNSQFKNITYHSSHIDKKLDTVIIKSKVKIKPNYIGHIINNLSHLPFDDNFDNSLERERQKIVNKYYFIRDNPKISIGTYNNNKLGMLINIQPEFNNFFSGLFGAVKSEQNKWSLNGEIDARFENIWGAMESIDFKWKNIDSTNQYFNLKLERPHFLRTGLGIIGHYNYQLVNNFYTESQYKIEFELINRSFGSFFFGFNGGSINTTDLGVKQNYRSTNYKAFTFMYRKNRLNRILLPDKGSSLTIEFDLGKDNNYDEFYYRSKLNHIGLFRINNIINICLKSYTEHINTINDNIEISRQIIFGGVNSLRGFDDSQFISKSVSIQTLELHYNKIESFQMSGFLESGFSIDYKPKLSYGIGFAKLTKKAFIKLEYALPITSSFDSGKIHIKWLARL